jgi:tRNA-specific 2-thiouridylase
MTTVFVGLSGGVDSAVSAALLKSAGYSVVGAFIKIWRPEFIDCPWERDRLDAMRVCAALEIPFREIDLSENYKKEVIDDMVSAYSRGVTPNPDVLCNRHIKFGHFSRWAFANGADFIATGHYAQNHDGQLKRGKDTNKDQSYFLWQLTKKDLERVLFPIGGLTKPEVRARAAKFDLPVAAKKESQGLCFVGDITMRDFLSQYLSLEKGAVLDDEGKDIGEHDGAALFTLGERHGFRIHSQDAQEPARYVIGIDTGANTITVSRSLTGAMRTSVRLIDMSWVGETPKNAQRFSAQTRYRETPIACTIEGSIVSFAEPHLTPFGQSLVLYDGDKCLGGGVISA